MSQRILLIQDNVADATTVRNSLAGSRDRKFSVEWVRTCALGLERLAAKPGSHGHTSSAFAAVIVDLLLPDARGVEIFERL